jgi:hypothetical protein
MNEEIIEIKEITNYSPPNVILWHPEKAKMTLAYCVLGAIFIIFGTSIECNYLAKREILEMVFANNLFDFCKTALLPLVTLILGYYFGKSE